MDGPRKSWDQRLFTLLWIWVSFKTLIPWLVFFRLTLEGDSYRWGNQYFNWTFYSSGFERADFLLIYALLAVGIFLLWQMRQYRFNVAGPALTTFLGVLAADAMFQFLRGVPIIFQGDTLGVNVDISIPFYGLQFVMFLAAIAWWAGVVGTRLAPPAPVAGFRRSLARICLLFIPAQIVLLVVGEPHGLTDQVGVIGTLLQWALLAYIFYPGSDYRSDV